MKKVSTCASWGLVVAAISLSPIVLIFGLPVAVGIGLDIFDRFGEAPFVLALCIPLVFALVRLVSQRAVPQWLAALSSRSPLPLRHTAEPNQAP
jgi:hypothetical protein